MATNLEKLKSHGDVHRGSLFPLQLRHYRIKYGVAHTLVGAVEH